MATLADLNANGLVEVSPGVFRAGPKKKKPEPILKPRSVLRLTGNSQILEDRFSLLWKSLGGPTLQREYRFCKTRKWRADFAHLPSMTLIEIEGGLYSGVGRHNSVEGYTLDAKKYNAAALLHYCTFRLTSKMLNPDHIQPIIDFVSKRLPKTSL